MSTYSYFSPVQTPVHLHYKYGRKFGNTINIKSAFLSVFKSILTKMFIILENRTGLTKIICELWTSTTAICKRNSDSLI